MYFFFQIANVRTASGKQAGEERVEPRFFLWYWYTSTATATKTTFTTTKTFTLTVCTPTTGFSYAGKLYTEIVKIYTIIVHYTTYPIFFFFQHVANHGALHHYYGRKEMIKLWAFKKILHFIFEIRLL